MNRPIGQQLVFFGTESMSTCCAMIRNFDERRLSYLQSKKKRRKAWPIIDIMLAENVISDSVHALHLICFLN